MSRDESDFTLLANCCENIRTQLLALPPEKWGSIKPGTQSEEQIPIELGLDPDLIIKHTKRVIFIMPIVLGYSIQDSAAGRGRIKRSVLSTILVSSAILIPFRTFTIGDVCNWDEVRAVIKLRERLENNIMALDLKDANFNIEYSLLECEPEPAQEIELNQRNYLAVTDFTFQLNKCVG